MDVVGESRVDPPSMQDKENIIVDKEPNLEKISGEIVRQCEFYFSDANILKDLFLLKQVKSSTDGWVKLNIVANFKKMQALSTDHDFIRKALAKSSKLELSENGERIRRRDPLPEWDKSVYGRSIILSDFPDDADVTCEGIKQFYMDKNRPPELVRVFLPGRKVSSDLKRTQILHPQLGVKISAIVEFADRPSALEAINFARSHWGQIYAYLLTHRNKKLAATTQKKDSKPVTSENSDMTRRPLFRDIGSLENQVRVIHLREPSSPPTDDSVGFYPGWREAVRYNRDYFRDGIVWSTVA
ncbi:unnamed protein product [Trichobilharzia szidati]|nr:unnamed protein product [Trichobilharzia szidati]